MWLKQMNFAKLFHKTYIFETTQVSDHALTQWTLHNRYAKIEAMHKAKNNNPDPTPVAERGVSGRKKGVKTGEHESKHQMKVYIQLYLKINEAYENDLILEKWNEKFWRKMEHHFPEWVVPSGPPDRNKKRALDADDDELVLPTFDNKNKGKRKPFISHPNSETL